MENSSILVCKVIRYGLMAKPGGAFITNKNSWGRGIPPPLVVSADAPESTLKLLPLRPVL